MREDINVTGFFVLRLSKGKEKKCKKFEAI